MSRDTQRSSVYAVEQRVFEETLFCEPIGAAGVVDLSATLGDEPWWQANGVAFEVDPARRESTHSSARLVRGVRVTGRIRLSMHQENAATIAHELAHLLAERHGGQSAHGPLFRTALVDVVALVCGTIAARRLADTFDECDLGRAARPWPAPEPVTDRGLYGRWRIAAQTSRSAGSEPADHWSHRG